MNTSVNSAMLTVQNLNKHFGAVHAVKDLSFQVNHGEVFGFLGPNGAGKTTTMRIVTCFIPATSGVMTIDGLNTQEHSLEIRKKIGYLPEATPLYNDMLVDEYLSFVGALRNLKGASLLLAKEKMYHDCGLGKVKQRQIGKLSKGYRQRVGLAQAMIHNPDLLILDEPTSGLDPNQIIEIRQLIKEIGKAKTVIYCSHILSEVAATCTRILIINNGSAVATGTPEELTASLGHGSLYRLSVKADKEMLKARFSELGSVRSVTITGESNGWVNCTISTADSTDIGESLFSCVVANKWSMSELKRESTSLENVFIQLTRG